MSARRTHLQRPDSDQRATLALASFNVSIFAGDKSGVAGVELATASEPPAQKPRIWGRRPSAVDPSHPLRCNLLLNLALALGKSPSAKLRVRALAISRPWAVVRSHRLSFLFVGRDPEDCLVEGIPAEGFLGWQHAIHFLCSWLQVTTFQRAKSMLIIWRLTARGGCGSVRVRGLRAWGSWRCRPSIGGGGRLDSGGWFQIGRVPGESWGRLGVRG
jgi:hypothetical protein